MGSFCTKTQAQNIHSAESVSFENTFSEVTEMHVSEPLSEDQTVGLPRTTVELL